MLRAGDIEVTGLVEAHTKKNTQRHSSLVSLRQCPGYPDVVYQKADSPSRAWSSGPDLLPQFLAKIELGSRYLSVLRLGANPGD